MRHRVRNDNPKEFVTLSEKRTNVKSAEIDCTQPTEYADLYKKGILLENLISINVSPILVPKCPELWYYCLKMANRPVNHIPIGCLTLKT